MRVFIKKGVRTDMERHYIWTPYNRAVDEAKQHLDVDGVKEYLVQVDKKADDYEAKMTSFLESERLVESEKYNTYEMAIKKYNLCVWVGVGLILIKIFLFFAMMAGSLETLYCLGHIVALIYIVVFIVLRVKASRAEKQYRVYSRNVLQQIAEINSSFQRIIDAMIKDVDQMYLASLDSTTLQMVLMRRELKEANKKNEELSKAMLNEQSRMRESQERMEEGQKQSRQIQQGILDNLNEWRDERHNRY